MHNKTLKNALTDISQNAEGLDTEQQTQKQVYKKPVMVCYGPLAKNISLGFLSGAETDSTFAV